MGENQLFPDNEVVIHPIAERSPTKVNPPMPYSVEIELTPVEMLRAGETGLYTWVESVKANRTPNFEEKIEGEMLLNHQLGAMGELAYCKMINRYWSGKIRNFDGADIGEKTQIRWTRLDNVKVRLTEKDIYVVALSGVPPIVTYHGWIYSNDAMKEKYMKDYNNRGKPAYFVPFADLNHTKFDEKEPF